MSDLSEQSIPLRTSFKFAVTPEEYVTAIKRNNRRVLRNLPTRWLVQICSAVLWGALAFLFFYTFQLMDGKNGAVARPVFVAVCVAILGFVLYAVFYYRGLYRLARESKYTVGVNKEMFVEDSGLRYISLNADTLTPWSDIVGIEEAGQVLLIYRDRLVFEVVPVSAFESQAENNAFVAHVRARIRGGAIEAGTAAAATASPSIAPGQPAAPKRSFASAVRGPFMAFRDNVVNAFRLAFFRKVPQERIAVAWWQIPAFALPGIVLPFLFALYKVGLDGQFAWYSLPGALFHLPVLLLGAIFVAYALGRSEKSLLFVQLFLMIALAIDVIFYGVETAVSAIAPRIGGRAFGSFVFYLPSIWLAAACAIAAARLTHWKFHRAVSAFVVSVILIALPMSFAYHDRSLWFPSRDSDVGGVPLMGLGSEDAFYGQPRILARELAAVQPGRKGVIDVYFIGMAGYSAQDVFMKEVDSVARLFRERFGAEGRTVRLVNNNKSLEDSPIASTTSLRLSLKRVSEVMNKDEDVLVLFMTSHGSENHHFSLALWPMRFHELDPLRLRALLDESGIKHRVVVVSACYSGGFLGALKDENTLVITASAPDKNSFGCSNEAEWTYFGKAYFDEALRKTYSFTEAFDLAKPVIVEREKQQGFDHSEPQISIGTAIQARLTQLERQLSSPKREPRSK